MRLILLTVQFFLLVFLGTLDLAKAQEADASGITVSVLGCVKTPGKYQLKTGATIERALAKAGGWNGVGEFDVPAKRVRLVQCLNGKQTDVAVSYDTRTKQFSVLDSKWKAYHLAEGDSLELPMVVL